MLREEFRALREQVKVRNGKVKKVLVFFGGVDADNYTFQAIEALAEVNAGLKVDVVIGAQHPFKEMIENACVKHDYVCHIQTPYMAKLMAEAELQKIEMQELAAQGDELNTALLVLKDVMI